MYNFYSNQFSCKFLQSYSRDLKNTFFDKVIYSPTDAQVIVLTTVLKYTLK